MITFDDTERKIVLGLYERSRLGLRQILQLKKSVGSLLELDRPGQRSVAVSSHCMQQLCRARAQGPLRDAGECAFERMQSRGIKLTMWGDKSYPRRFLHLSYPPVIVYYRGRLPQEDMPTIAIVGSRSCTRYGSRMARKFSEDLSGRGVVVVSGLARGVDSAAHEGALKGRTPTYAVLGCGLTRVYPPENLGLYEEIEVEGGLLTEFSMDTPPLSRNFPRRNRLIAALAQAVLVVEARRKSGAVITARWAGELGRDVLAVPGQVDNPACEGVLDLLRDGAVLVRNGEDVAEELGLEPREGTSVSEIQAQSLTSREVRILSVLDHEAIFLDEVIHAVQEPVADVLASLLVLEMKGDVEQEPGLKFRRVRQ